MSDSTLKPVLAAGRLEEVKPGQTIGRYRVHAPLGAGGMGVVYRALDTESGLEVALKVLRPADADDPERRARFLREARVAAALDHPAIARVHEVGELGETIFIAMQLVPGKSLRAWIGEPRARGELPSVADALKIARSIAGAIAYAHEKGVVHRDLKPDNVMVERDLRVSVLDFGLAKLREAPGGALYDAETESNLTRAGRVLGTPGYMAPEQAAGKEVGFRADVFAFGAILYEALTGARAFGGASPLDVIVATARDHPPPPSAKNPAVSAELDELVARCLAKAPDARPTMAQLTTELARPGLAGARLPRRRARTWGFAAGVIASAVAIAGWSAARGRHPAPASPAASASAPAPPVPTTLTDLPAPESTVPAAREAYARALVEAREGAEDAALIDLDRATTLDPELAAAHLRLAERLATYEAQSARAHFAQAVKARARLSPRDRELCDASQPLFQRDPPDMDEWRRRMVALAARFPGDAELAYESAVVHHVLGEFPEAIAATERAVAVDPRYGLALSELAQSEAYAGRFDAARATVARCLEVSPTASSCMWVREFMDGLEGRCAATESSARQRIAADPTIPDGYKALSFALAALDRPPAVVREAIDQAVQRVRDPFAQRRLGLNMTIRLELLQGDLAGAAAHADELRAHVAARSDVSDHAAATNLSTEIAHEMGRRDRVAEITKTFLDREEVWQSNPIVHDYTLAEDLTPAILSFAYHAKAMPRAKYDAALDAWRRRWDAGLRGGYRPYLWVYGYAAVVETPEDAAEVLPALAAYSPIPPFIPDGALPEASIGRTLWLAGREDEGVAYLRRAARSCDTIVRPVKWIRAHAWLAEALEKRGDIKGACQALGTVLAHWGSARPRSVTAEAARARSRALGCPR